MLLHFESDSFEICGEACGEASMNNINGTMKNVNVCLLLRNKFASYQDMNYLCDRSLSKQSKLYVPP